MTTLVLFLTQVAVFFAFVYLLLYFRSKAREELKVLEESVLNTVKALETTIKAINALNNKTEDYEKTNRSVQNNLLEVAKLHQEYIEDLLTASKYSKPSKDSKAN